MIVLYIFLIILLLILALLLVPVKVNAEYEQELFLEIKYLFLKINPFEEKEEKQSEKEEKKSEEEKPKKTSKIKEIYNQRGAKGFLILIKNLFVLISKETYGIIKHIKIENLDIFYLSGGDDASSVAMDYGKACEIVYPFIGVIKSANFSRNVFVTIDLDYNLQKSRVIANCKVSLMPIFAVKHLVKMAVSFLKIMLKKER